jgi:hypothetical protein
MKVNILVGTEELAQAFKRLLKYVFNIDKVNIFFLGQTKALSYEVLEADFWIIEAFHPFEPNNPEGFRTAYKLAGKSKFLLLLLNVPQNFPNEGKFWCNIFTSNICAKIREVLDTLPPTKKDFDALTKIWPQLLYEPKRHH